MGVIRYSVNPHPGPRKGGLWAVEFVFNLKESLPHRPQERAREECNIPYLYYVLSISQ